MRRHKTDSVFGPATIGLDRSASTYLSKLYAFTGLFNPPSTAALFPTSFASRNEPKGLEISRVAQLFSGDIRYTANLVRKLNESLAFQGLRSGYINHSERKAMADFHLHGENMANTKYVVVDGATKAIQSCRMLQKLHVSFQSLVLRLN